MVARKIKDVQFVYNLVLKLTFPEKKLFVRKESVEYIARVTGARGEKLNFAPPPQKNSLK